ncbi:unnamed protein product [Strongylus vulgaris]|uniref:Uncharacterized protein n=1 Tax=Strongylus vulgaris TaxID=40348 RepID=A0A3P7J9B6_STRVU|nr:unnamed protein product [Strongylus vulgaris]
MESTTEILHQFLSLVNIRVKPLYPQWKITTRILLTEVRAAIQTMKAATALGPDHISANLLRAEGCLHEILAAHLPSKGKDSRPVEKFPNNSAS